MNSFQFSGLKTIWHRLPKGTVILSAVALANVLMGFAREATIAYFFGTSADLDSFLVALALPQVLVINLAEISVAVVLPLYIGYRQAKKNQKATELVQKWFWFSGIVIGTVCVLLFAGADLLMHIIAPGFDATRHQEATDWFRIMVPYVWLLSVAGIFKVVLNSHDKFFLPAVSPLFVSVSVMLFCVFGVQTMGVGALAAGFLAGGLLGFAWQCINSMRFEPKLLSPSGFHKYGSLPLAASGAMVLHSLARQLNVLVDRAFASGLSEGSIAAYNYANMINSIPTTIVTSALATALFPVLARLTSGGDWQGALRAVRNWSILLCLFGIGPVLVLVFFRYEITSLVFQRGAFDEAAVEVTASVLQVIPFMILTSLVATLFTQLLLAQRRTRMVAALSIFAIVIKIGLNFVLVPQFGLVGLALATLCASVAASMIRVAVVHGGGPTLTR